MICWCAVVSVAWPAVGCPARGKNVQLVLAKLSSLLSLRCFKPVQFQPARLSLSVGLPGPLLEPSWWFDKSSVLLPIAAVLSRDPFASGSTSPHLRHLPGCVGEIDGLGWDLIPCNLLATPVCPLVSMKFPLLYLHLGGLVLILASCFSVDVWWRLVGHSAPFFCLFHLSLSFVCGRLLCFLVVCGGEMGCSHLG